MKRWLGGLYLRLTGWKLLGGPPPAKKCVIVAAPHTSNWDVPAMLAMSYVLGIRISWVGKHTLFTWPLGYLMRALGGVPVDRRSRHNAVEQLAAEFSRRAELYLVVPPEGTRGRAEYWKTGFYYIAVEAGVPIVLGLLDFGKHEGGLFKVIHPSGDIRADMDLIRAFYTGVSGRNPECFGPVRLKEEIEQAATP